MSRMCARLLVAVLLISSLAAVGQVAPKPPFASATGNMGSERYGAAAVVLQDGRVFIAGGVSAAGARLQSTEIYDPVSRTFSPAAD